jgi:hypothetical protein
VASARLFHEYPATGYHLHLGQLGFCELIHFLFATSH